MTNTQAKQLPTPILMQFDRDELRLKNGTWKQQRLYFPARLDTWAVIVCNEKGALPEHSVNRFCNQMARVAESIRMDIIRKAPSLIKYTGAMVSSRYDDRLAQKLRSCYGDITKKIGHIPDIILVVLPIKGSLLYANVKSFFELDNGVMTQCVIQDKVTRPNPGYIYNLLFKINTKLGGITTALNEKSLPGFKDQVTMVLGLDISHPGPGQQGSEKGTLPAMQPSLHRPINQPVAFERILQPK